MRRLGTRLGREGAFLRPNGGESVAEPGPEYGKSPYASLASPQPSKLKLRPPFQVCWASKVGAQIKDSTVDDEGGGQYTE